MFKGAPAGPDPNPHWPMECPQDGWLQLGQDPDDAAPVDLVAFSNRGVAAGNGPIRRIPIDSLRDCALLTLLSPDRL